MFVERWSPRAFTGEPISESTLLTIIEAARWAPSAFNVQPWRFIHARRDTPAWSAIFSTLHPFNQAWAERASALVVIGSAEHSQPPGATEMKPNGTHEFDAGAAWGYLAMQAHLLGWHTHGVAGFDKAQARTNLHVPAGYALHAVAVIGRRSDDKSFLSASLQARETPSPRLPLRAIAAEG